MISETRLGELAEKAESAKRNTVRYASEPGRGRDWRPRVDPDELLNLIACARFVEAEGVDWDEVERTIAVGVGQEYVSRELLEAFRAALKALREREG